MSFFRVFPKEAGGDVGGKGEEREVIGAYVGLRVSNTPPHQVIVVRDILDANGVEQGFSGYSNPSVFVGDFVTAVDGHSVENTTTADLRRLLSGPPDTLVSLALRRGSHHAHDRTMQHGEGYTVTLLRHLAGAPLLDETIKHKWEIAKLHAEGHLLVRLVEAWINVLPWLKYSARNSRLVGAACRKRNEKACQACFHALSINRMRMDHRLRLVHDTSRRSCLMMSWSKWIRTTLDTKNRQHIFTCLQMRASSRQLREGFAAKLISSEFRKSAHAHFVAWSQLIRWRRRLLYCCKDLRRRWQLSLLSSKFRWWVTAFVNWLDLRENAGNIFHRVISRQSSCAFNQWAISVSQNRRLLVIGVRALLRMSHCLLRRAMRSLFLHAKSRRRMMATFRMVASRCCGRRLNASFLRFKEYAQQSFASRAMQKRAVILLTRNLPMKHLFRWRDKVLEAYRVAYALSKYKHLQMTGKITLHSSVIFRNVNRRLFSAMQFWRVATRHFNDNQKAVIVKVARALTRHNFQNMDDVFVAWHDRASVKRRLLKIWMGVNVKDRSRSMFDGFHRWQQHTTAQRRLVVAAAKIIATRDRICVTGYFQWLAQLTFKWKSISVWCDRMEISIMKWYFSLWCREAEKNAQNQRKWNFTSLKIIRALVRRAFEQWRVTHVETDLFRQTSYRLALRMGIQLTKAPCFRHWQGLIRHRKWRNRTLRFGRMHQKSAVMTRFWKLWTEHAQYYRMVRRVSRRIKVRWFAMLGTQAFYVWQRYLSRNSHIKALLHNLFIHRHFFNIGNFFSIWRQAVQERNNEELFQMKAEKKDRINKVMSLNERLAAAEHLAHVAETAKQTLVDELVAAREECAAAYRIIESLNQSEQGAKSRIDVLVSRLDDASYMYERLEETQTLVQELESLKRASTDDINRLKLELDVAFAEREGFQAELLEIRERLNKSKQDLQMREQQLEVDKRKADEFASQFARQFSSVHSQLDKVEKDVKSALAICSVSTDVNSAVRSSSAATRSSDKSLQMKQNQHASGVMQVMSILLKLGLDFRVAGTAGSSQRDLFESNVIQDLSFASGLACHHFKIKRVSPGSVLVEVEIHQSPAVTDTLEIAKMLEHQISNPNSALRNGATTRYTTSITYVQAIPPDQTISADCQLPVDMPPVHESSQIASPQKSSRAQRSGPPTTAFDLFSTQGETEDVLGLDVKDQEGQLDTQNITLVEKDKIIEALEYKFKSAQLLHQDLLAQIRNKDERNEELKTRVQRLEEEMGLVPSPGSGHKDAEKMSAFQGTLLKAEAALAEQSKIVEAQEQRLMTQDSELVEAQAAIEAAQKAIESADTQKKLLQANLQDAQTNLERALEDLVTQKDISDSVTVQLEKLSLKNAELTKELASKQKVVDLEQRMHMRLRQQFELMVSAQKPEGSTSQTSRGDLVLEIDSLRRQEQDLIMKVEELKLKVSSITQRRSDELEQAAEQAARERQKLQKEKQEAVDAKQIVIDKLHKKFTQIVDKNREKRSKAEGDDRIEELRHRATAAENAVRESTHVYQTLHSQMLAQEQEISRLKQALESGGANNRDIDQSGNLDVDCKGAENMTRESLDSKLLTAEKFQRELNESLVMMRTKTRWECLTRAQEGLLKRSRWKLLDVTFSCWANQTEERAFEKLLDTSVGLDAKSPKSQITSSKQSPVNRYVQSPRAEEGVAHSSAPPRVRFGNEIYRSGQGLEVLGSEMNSGISSLSSSPAAIRNIQNMQRPSPGSSPQGSSFSSLSTSPDKFLSPGKPLRSAPPSPESRHQALVQQRSLQTLAPQLPYPSGPLAGPPAGMPTLAIPLVPNQPAGFRALSFRDETLQVVGLQLHHGKGPPYIVEHGFGLIDVFGVKQGDPNYSNQVVEEGDTLLFVDSQDVSSLGEGPILQRLRGESLSQVHLVFSSRRNASLYRVTVLRHSVTGDYQM